MPPMEQLTKNQGKIYALLSLHSLLLILPSLAFFSWIVFGLTPIQESMAPLSLDCLHCIVFMFDTLCSNSAFLLLLCNVIIGALMALSKSTETPDIYTLYVMESESRRKQFGGFAEASSKGKTASAEMSGFREICRVEKVQHVEIDGGDENCIWSSNLALVPYHYAGITDEELDHKFEQFIIQIRNQISMEQQFGGFAEPSSKGKIGSAERSEFRNICSVEKVQQVEMDGGHENCIWGSNLAVVPYHHGGVTDEELDHKFDQFIFRIRRQMSMEQQA